MRIRIEISAGDYCNGFIRASEYLDPLTPKSAKVTRVAEVDYRLGWSFSSTRYYVLPQSTVFFALGGPLFVIPFNDRSTV